MIYLTGEKKYLLNGRVQKELHLVIILIGLADMEVLRKAGLF